MENTQKNVRRNENLKKIVIIIILFTICCIPFYSFAESESSIQECDLSKDGYSSIFTSGTTGRQFKEFKQNAESYEYPNLNNSYWEIECATIATGIIGSGYKNLEMQDIADELNGNNGKTDIQKFLCDFTGHNTTQGVNGLEDFKNKLSQGYVAVFWNLGYNNTGHCMAILDINKSKTEIYISNPDTYNMPFNAATYQGWNPIERVYDVIEKDEIYFVKNNEIRDGWDSTTTVDYPNGITRTYKNYKQYKGTYTNNYYWGGTIQSAGCGPTSVSIILSGYGIDANPGEVVKSMAELGYDYSSMEVLKKVLKDKYNISSEIENVSSNSIQHIKDNFNSGRPIIAGVSNHFITYLGEDSNGKLILSDPGYEDRNYGDTISDYVSNYNGDYQILLVTTGEDLLETTIDNEMNKNARGGTIKNTQTTSKIDTTLSNKSSLPKTGLVNMIMTIILVAVGTISIVSYLRYRRYRKL